MAKEKKYSDSPKNNDPKGYYKILGVSFDANLKEIKKSYREKAKYWHPDKGMIEDAENKFKLLSEAYENLSDEILRALYDLSSISSINHIQAEICDKCLNEQNNSLYINIKTNIGFVFYQKRKNTEEILCNKCARKKASFANIINVLLGFISIFPWDWFYNIKSILTNNSFSDKPADNLGLLTTKACNFYKERDYENAYYCLIEARKYTKNKDIISLIDRITSDSEYNKNIFAIWNKPLIKLKAILYLIIIFALSIILYKAPKSPILLEETTLSDKASSISISQELIRYNVFRYPINVYDKTKLYHVVKNQSKVYYGPSEQDDIIKSLESDITVRITGYIPKSDWVRIMMSDGIMGFTKKTNLKAGLGNKKLPIENKILKTTPSEIIER